MSIEINQQTQFDLDDIDLILSLLPKNLREYLNNDQRKYDLTEIVLDLGRKPIIRFMEESIYLDQQSRITEKDIKQLIAKVGSFKSNNRAGINGTLHRIAAIRNNDGAILGITIRIGRVVEGAISLI